MKKYFNKYLLIFSLVLPLLLVFIDPYNFHGGVAYGLGIPFDFLLYMDPLGPPESKLDLFGNLIKINFKVEVYAASALVFYIALMLVFSLSKKYQGGKNQ